jgi:hypothetical protein
VEEEEEKKRRAIVGEVAAAEAATAATDQSIAPMRYGGKRPNSKDVRGKQAAPAAAPAAGTGLGPDLDGAPAAAAPTTSSPVLPVSSSGGAPILPSREGNAVLPLSTSGAGDMRMESIGGSFSGAFPVAGGAAVQLQQQQQQRRSRKSGLFGFWGRADAPVAAAPAANTGGRRKPHLFEDDESASRAPTLPGHLRGSEAGGPIRDPMSRTRVSLLATGPADGDAAAAQRSFAASLGLGGPRTQQMRQVPRAQGITLDDSGDGSVATATVARGGVPTQRKARQGGAEGSGDAVARVGWRMQVRQPAFQQSSGEEVEATSPNSAPSRSYQEVLGDSGDALHSEELVLEDRVGAARREQQAWGRAAGVARSLGLMWQSVTGGTSGDGADEPSKQA